MSIMHTEPDAAAEAVIGPNAITRMAQALSNRVGDELCAEIFSAAGISGYLKEPPTRMAPQSEVSRLHCETYARLGESRAAVVAWEAGLLTGDYLLANRIPLTAQRLLKLTPRALSARILVAAIARHSWTFAGGGIFSYAFDPHLRLTIAGSPICLALHTQQPACHYFAATFERVFGEMLGPSLHVVESKCEATGASACVFDVTW
jgi:divinyl protochlorophyllide a 8-vinyl-reductase